MIRAISNVTFVAFALALWVCSMESARGAIWVDSKEGADSFLVNGIMTVNPGTWPSAPLKTIGAAMNRLTNTATGTSSETTVYVRGGGHDRIYNEEVIVPKSGTPAQPLRIIGWVGTTPPTEGTIPQGSVPQSLADAQARTSNYNMQPVLFGGVPGAINDPPRKPIAFNVYYRQWVEIYNFDICYYESSGVEAATNDQQIKNVASNCKLKSLFVYEIGRDDSSYVAANPTGTGNGIAINGRKSSTIELCTVLNCRRSGICFQNCDAQGSYADNNTALNCRAYNDVYGVVYTSGIKNGEINKFAGTDYYYHVIESTGCQVISCWAERGLNANHAGHAFVLQANDKAATGEDNSSVAKCQGNKIITCRSKNIGDPALLRGVVTQCTFTGLISDSTRDSNELNYGNIRLEAGPNGNVFELCQFYNSRVAIMVVHNPGGRTPKNAEGNFIRNCLFETTDTAIQGHKDGGALNFGLFTTYIIGCTFKGLPSGTPPVNSSRFFYMDRPAGDNQLINCVIMNYPNYRNVPGPYTDTDTSTPEFTGAPYLTGNGQTIGFTFQKCCIFNVGAPLDSAAFVSQSLLGPGGCFLSNPNYQSNTTYVPALYYFNGPPLLNAGIQTGLPDPMRRLTHTSAFSWEVSDETPY